MACSFNFFLSDVCTKRFGSPVKGTHGRGAAHVLGIVLHELPMGYEEYIAEVGRDIPSTSLFTNPVIPRSGHILFNREGNAALIVSEGDSAWGLNGLNNPTDRALGLIQNPAAPEQSLIHVLFEHGGQTVEAMQSAANAICCYALRFNIPLDEEHIVDAEEFNVNEENLGGVAQAILNMARVCYARGGEQPAPDPVPPSLARIIHDLQTCCADGIAAQAALANRVLALESWKVTAQNTIDDLSGRVLALEHNQLPVTALPAIYAQLASLVQQVTKLQICAAKVCGDDCPPTNCTNIHYRIDRESQYQLIPPNVNTWLFANGSTKIEDSAIPQVLNSALWVAALTCACTWNINLNVHIQMRDWCAGKQVWLDMVTDLGRFRLATWTASAGYADPTLSGQMSVVVPPSANVHFEIASNDNRMAQIIVDYADIQINCASA